MSQYALSLALPAIFAEGNYAISASNAEAHQWVSTWPSWPAHALFLSGPEASGKSHLGYIWMRRANAQAINASALESGAIAAMGRQNWLVENLEELADQEALLHLFNLTREEKHFLLLTSKLTAQQLALTLPDLSSRLLALPAAAIHDADDEMVVAILRKQFADRQLKVENDIIQYLLPRIDRSYIKINELIASLDHAALSQRKKLTIPFVRDFLSLPPVPTA